MMSKINILLVIIILSILAFCNIANSKIIHVPADSSTIQAGINGAADGDTVLVADGTYFENIDFKGVNIILASLFIFTQDTSNILNTIIDGGDQRQVIKLINDENNSTKIVGFTICNGRYSGAGIYCENSSPTIENNLIRDNFLEQNEKGAGIYCINASPIIKNNKIQNNELYPYMDAEGAGGGIYCQNSSPLIENNIISNNMNLITSVLYGGGIYCLFCTNTIIKGNVISNNSAKYGGGIFLYESDVLLLNNIIANNNAWSTAGGIYTYGSNLYIDGCTIFGNTADNAGGIYCGGKYSFGTVPYITRSIIWECSLPEVVIADGVHMGADYCVLQTYDNGLTNIMENPLFCDPENGDFHLQESSPCLPENNEYDVLMGALGVGCTQTDIDENNELLPFEFSLQQNVPNPFNPSTKISFSLPRRSFVNLSVYNLLGQKIETLVNKEMEVGSYNLNWNGKDMASGIYFYRLETGDFVETKKMVLLK